MSKRDVQNWAKVVAFVRFQTAGVGADVVANCTFATNTETAALLAAREVEPLSLFFVD